MKGGMKYAFVTFVLFFLIYSVYARGDNNKYDVSSYIINSKVHDFYKMTNRTEENHVFVLYYTPWLMSRQTSLAYLELYDLYHHHRDYTTNFLAYNCEIAQSFCEKQGVQQLPSLNYYFNNTVDYYSGENKEAARRNMDFEGMKSYVLERAPSLLREKIVHESDYCIGFKRTNKKYTKRIARKDVNCIDLVRYGVIGYCECVENSNDNADDENDDEGSSDSMRIKINISFHHEPFRCVDYCMAHYNSSKTCDGGWRETKHCGDFDINLITSNRNEARDESCFTKIVRGRSGYCECRNGKNITFGCDHDDIYCDKECDI